MEVSGQLHTPAALPSGKAPQEPIGQEAGWATETLVVRQKLVYIKGAVQLESRTG